MANNHQTSPFVYLAMILSKVSSVLGGMAGTLLPAWMELVVVEEAGGNDVVDDIMMDADYCCIDVWCPINPEILIIK